jgi:DNA replication and repair protein RecF
MLCQIAPPYCRTLSRYNQIVTQRNALLRDLRERGGPPTQLAFWDERLVEYGAYLVARRGEAVAALDERTNAVHRALTNGAEQLHLRYEPSVELDGDWLADTIGPAYAAHLQALRQREIAAGMTLMGPHRDEMRFLIDGVDAGVYGSRGQQRTAALAVKLAEVDLMHHETGELPVLLLDDVFSELDAHRRGFLVGALQGGSPQAIITTTGLPSLPEAFLQSCQLWRVEMGRLGAVAV